MRDPTPAWLGLVMLLVTLATTRAVAATTLAEAIGAAADRLLADQVDTGILAGSWPGEAGYTGSIAAGMVSAFRATGNAAYKTAAQNAGNYILTANAATGNYYGDEVYALTRLSEVAADPSNNSWRTAAGDFYDLVKDSGAGTSGYISAFSGTGASNATFYLSHHAVAAHYVNADEEDLWRQGVVDFLATVHDGADYPVLALGISVWALAQTGPMDATLVDPAAAPGSTWFGTTLADLPGLLRGHQVTAPDPYAGSLYWRFDHTDGGDPANEASGYTEDALFGVFGMWADNQATPSPVYPPALYAASEALLDAVDGAGVVGEHIWLDGEDYYTYAGEYIEGLLMTARPGDADLDGHVNSVDLGIWQANYDTTDPIHDWYQGDWNGDRLVNSADLALWQANYLAPEPTTLALIGVGGLALTAMSRRRNP